MSTASRGSARKTLARRIGLEVAAVIAVWLAVGIALAAISTDPRWVDVLYTDADSLVLPLFQQSIHSGDNLDWVFSSQFFLFPELLTYAASTLLVTGVRETLTINAVVNVAIVYALLRVIAHLIRSRAGFASRIAAALGATFVLIVVVVLEQSGNSRASVLATPLLTSTYYVGAIHCGLAVVALTLWVTRGFDSRPWGRLRSIVFIASTLVISTLAAFSDPLFAAWVSAPLVFALLAVVVARRLHILRATLIVVVQAVSIILALRGRSIFSDLSTAPLNGYVHPEQFPLTVLMFQHDWDELTSTGLSVVRLIVLGALFAVAVIGGAIAVIRSIARRDVSGSIAFSFAFAAVSVVSVIAGTLITGTSVPRYMAPLIVSPLIPLVVLTVERLGTPAVTIRIERSRRFVTIAAAVVSLLLVVSSVSTAPRVMRAVSGTEYTTPECFNDFVGEDTINGVGEYWVTRPLQLYGDGRGEVLQAQTVFTGNETFNVFPWMINLASYEDKTFSYVLVDTGVHDSRLISPEAIALLGAPSQVVTCSTYEIYDFRGTPGEALLTEQMRIGIESLQATRAQ